MCFWMVSSANSMQHWWADLTYFPFALVSFQLNVSIRSLLQNLKEKTERLKDLLLHSVSTRQMYPCKQLYTRKASETRVGQHSVLEKERDH